MPDTPLTTDERRLEISDSAARRIAELARADGSELVMLRVTVSGGGCSGFQYAFSLEKQTAEDDIVFESNGVRVVVDDVSLNLVTGARLDYVDELIGASFKLDNPNATSSCGCGSSFSV